jgi:integrase
MLYQRGEGKTWWYRFRFAGRIVHESARTRSKTVAREAERQRRRELEAKWNRIEKRTLPPAFEKASGEWQAGRIGRFSANTVVADRRALRHLLPAFGSTLLSDTTADDIARYQAKRLEQGAEGRTVNMEVTALRQILRRHGLWLSLAEDAAKREIPLTLSERRDIGKALTPDEEARLLAATEQTDSACHTATLLALNTAMRRDEIRKLRWGQIDWEKRTLTVGKAKTPEGSGRVIPLNPTAFTALVRWAGRFPEAKPEHYVFPWCESRHVDPTRATKGWRTAWRNALKRAGVRCRFHDLRVTCITKLSEGQASDQTIMAIAGHVSRRMLEHYSRIRMDAKRAALEAIARQPQTPVFEAGVHQIGNQIPDGLKADAANLLN